MSPILKSFLILMGFLFNGKNWDPTAIRSLGCYLPFNLSPSISSNFGSGGLSSCQPCKTEQFVMLRGDQCMCIDAKDIPNLKRVQDQYCDVCYPGSDIFCGGNLGGSLYCNRYVESCYTIGQVPEPSLDIYRSFNDEPGGFERQEPCLNAGCGQPDFWNLKNLTYLDYFPDLSPESCIIFCTYEKTAYALVGYYSIQKLGSSLDSAQGATMVPACACSNVTLPADSNAVSCSSVPCSSAVGSCGNKDPTLPSWGVYCTTVTGIYPNGTRYCSPYYPITSVITKDIVDSDQEDTCNFLTNVPSLQTDETVETPLDTTTIETTTEPEITTPTSTAKIRTLPPTKAVSIPSGDPKTEPEDTTTISSTLTTNLALTNDDCSILCYASKPLLPYKIGDEPTPAQCDSGPCPNFNDVQSCYFQTENKCYVHSQITDTLGENRLKEAKDLCNSLTGHLLAIESDEERIFITETYHTILADLGSPCLLTSGVKNGNQSYWDLPTGSKSISESIAQEVVNCPVSDSGDNLTFLMLQNPSVGSNFYQVWRYAGYEDVSETFICEFDPPDSPATTSGSTAVDCGPLADCSAGTAMPSIETSTFNPTKPVVTVPPPREDRCFCERTDIYHNFWTVEGGKTEIKSCREGAAGNASWSCDYIGNSRKCQFRTEQPDYSFCHSDELDDIGLGVTNNETDLITSWIALCNFTKPDDKYFGHEIHTVLSLVTQLLNRQDWELNANETDNNLPFQVQTTQIGSEIIDNVVSHDAQWYQIDQEMRSDYALYMIDVAEDLGFRLSDVAQSTNQSLRCETLLPNVTLSSSFWNGYQQAQVSGCDLSDNASTWSPQGDIFQRFPLTDQSGSSFIVIPAESILPGQVHKASGVLIAHYILDHLLPGSKTEPKGLKKVNSPLISYTIKGEELSDLEPAITEIPAGTFVEIVFQHAATAKNPPVRTLRRDLDPGEVPSAVIGSASCAFLNYTPDAHLWTGLSKLDSISSEKSWTWDSQGCFLVSTNRSHTVCKCSHLTGFSAIMDFHNYTGQSIGLEITGITCSSFSIVSLAVTFIVLTILRSIKTDRTIITQNLCISLLLSHILTLVTLDRHFLHLDDVTCATMGILLHFSLITSFMWMGVEGLRLCRIVLYVFNVTDWTLYYLLVAYLVPLLIVGSTILSAYLTTGITSAYAGDETCWLVGDKYLWAFAGPVTAIILANVVFTVIAVHSSWNLKQNLDRKMPAKIKNMASMTLSLTCLLGITWLSGFFLYTDTMAFAYIFTITNGLQGVMILLFRCVLNDEVRTALEERYKRYKDKNRMGKWSSMLTNVTSANRGRPSFASGSDGGKDMGEPNDKLSGNQKLSQSTSQTSVSSGSTDISPEQHSEQRAIVRTVSGTEFSECSSEGRGSICSSILEAPVKSDDIESMPNATRVSRRVSFLTVSKLSSTEPLASRRRLSDLHN